MSDECGCGWCGRCVKQLEDQRRIENTRGYGCDYWSDDETGDEE